MTGWIIFGCVIAVFALLLSLSLVIRVEMDDDGLRARMGIGPFGIGHEVGQTGCCHSLVGRESVGKLTGQ